MTWSYPPGGSGLGRAAREIAQGLRTAGVDVTVVNAADPFGAEDIRDGLRIVGCGPPPGGPAGFVRKLPLVGHLVAPWYFRRAVLRLCASGPVDLIEATNWYAPAALLALGPVPLIVRNSTPALDARAEAAAWRDRADLWFAHRLERWTARRAAALISNTESHRALIDRLYRLKGGPPHAVVSLALDPATLRRAEASPAPSDRPGEAEQSLLFIGRAERRKGFAEMLGGYLEASRQRRASKGRPIALTIVGIAPEEVARALRAHGEEIADHPRLHIRPEVSDAALHDLYDAATAVIAPSRYESFGLVYREAAAFGRPLIACAEDPAACALVRQARCGVLADTCSAPDIARAALDLLDDPDLCARLGAAGRVHAASLSRARLGSETRQIYEQVGAIPCPAFTA